MIDITNQIDQVDRAVSTRNLDSGEANVATISQSYGTTVEDVWDACTNIERMPRWLMPVTGELRPGGRYQIEGNASGVVERCDPPEPLLAPPGNSAERSAGSTSHCRARRTAPACCRGHGARRRRAVGAVRPWRRGRRLGLHAAGPGAAPVVRRGEDRRKHELVGLRRGQAVLAGSSQRWCDAEYLHGADPVAAQRPPTGPTAPTPVSRKATALLLVSAQCAAARPRDLRSSAPHRGQRKPGPPAPPERQARQQFGAPVVDLPPIAAGPFRVDRAGRELRGVCGRRQPVHLQHAGTSQIGGRLGAGQPRRRSVAGVDRRSPAARPSHR